MYSQFVHKDHVTLDILYMNLYTFRLFNSIIQSTLSCILTSCLGCDEYNLNVIVLDTTFPGNETQPIYMYLCFWTTVMML